jgi:hypothetical protein
MRLPYFGFLRKCFPWVVDRFLPGFVLLLCLVFSYDVGYIEATIAQKPPLFVQKQVSLETLEMGSSAGSGVVASKSGTTFYYPWCSGRNRIKPENERWFGSPGEALKYGLKPAQNCLGL